MNVDMGKVGGKRARVKHGNGVPGISKGSTTLCTTLADETYEITI
jgi:hypothetical protein